jgi:hypothetical protein
MPDPSVKDQLTSHHAELNNSFFAGRCFAKEEYEFLSLIKSLRAKEFICQR